jgi:hypothetical protein
MAPLIPDLKKRIEEFQNTMFPQLPADIVQALMSGIDDLVLAGIDRAALREGGKAPDFDLPDPTGKRVRLSDLLAAGPAVVTFYRGGW